MKWPERWDLCHPPPHWPPKFTLASVLAYLATLGWLNASSGLWLLEIAAQLQSIFHWWGDSETGSHNSQFDKEVPPPPPFFFLSGGGHPWGTVGQRLRVKVQLSAGLSSCYTKCDSASSTPTYTTVLLRVPTQSWSHLTERHTVWYDESKVNPRQTERTLSELMETVSVPLCHLSTLLSSMAVRAD